MRQRHCQSCGLVQAAAIRPSFAACLCELARAMSTLTLANPSQVDREAKAKRCSAEGYCLFSFSVALLPPFATSPPDHSLNHLTSCLHQATASTNGGGYTALMLAAKEGRDSCVAELLTNGANVHAIADIPVRFGHTHTRTWPSNYLPQKLTKQCTHHP